MFPEQTDTPAELNESLSQTMPDDTTSVAVSADTSAHILQFCRAEGVEMGRLFQVTWAITLYTVMCLNEDEIVFRHVQFGKERVDRQVCIVQLKHDIPLLQLLRNHVRMVPASEFKPQTTIVEHDSLVSLRQNCDQSTVNGEEAEVICLKQEVSTQDIQANEYQDCPSHRPRSSI